MPSPKTSQRLLLVGDAHVPPAELPAVLKRDSKGEIHAVVSRAVGNAIEQLGRPGFDAVVCWANREEELAGIIRIRKARPELPIMVFTSQRDATFRDLARRMGATRILPKSEGPKVLLETVQLALRTGVLARELRSQSQAVGRSARTILGLVRDTRSLVNRAREICRQGSGPEGARQGALRERYTLLQRNFQACKDLPWPERERALSSLSPDSAFSAELRELLEIHDTYTDGPAALRHR